jgi:hypothetical protein
VPEIIKLFSLSATAINASNLLKYLSVRQSFASSTAALVRFPACFSSFASSLSNKVRASAVEPANPAITFRFSIFLTFFAELFMSDKSTWHGTTIVLIRKDSDVVVAGDGQVSLGNTVIKSSAKKVRKIEKRNVIAGFAGSTADALTLFERLEAKLEKHAGNLTRAAVELAKDWRTDKYLRRLEALMA